MKQQLGRDEKYLLNPKEDYILFASSSFKLNRPTILPMPIKEFRKYYSVMLESKDEFDAIIKLNSFDFTFCEGIPIRKRYFLKELVFNFDKEDYKNIFIKTEDNSE